MKKNQVIVIMPFRDYESDMKMANMFGVCLVGFCLLPVKLKIMTGMTVLFTVAFSEFIKPSEPSILHFVDK